MTQPSILRGTRSQRDAQTSVITTAPAQQGSVLERTSRTLYTLSVSIGLYNWLRLNQNVIHISYPLTEREFRESLQNSISSCDNSNKTLKITLKRTQTGRVTGFPSYKRNFPLSLCSCSCCWWCGFPFSIKLSTHLANIYSVLACQVLVIYLTLDFCLFVGEEVNEGSAMLDYVNIME